MRRPLGRLGCARARFFRRAPAWPSSLMRDFTNRFRFHSVIPDWRPRAPKENGPLPRAARAFKIKDAFRPARHGKKKWSGPRRRRPDHAGFNQSRTGSVGGSVFPGRRAGGRNVRRNGAHSNRDPFLAAPAAGKKKKKNLLRPRALSPRAAAPEETRNGRRELVSNRRVASVRSGRCWECSAPCVRRGVEMG